jgi:hypothetical protein
MNFDEKCVQKHIQDNPDHVMIIIQEPLPYNSKSSKVPKHKMDKPILPAFKFKEQSGSEHNEAQ